MTDRNVTRFEFVQGEVDNTESIYLVYAQNARQVAVATVRLNKNGFYSVSYNYRGIFYAAYATTTQPLERTFVNTLQHSARDLAKDEFDNIKTDLVAAVVEFIREFYEKHRPEGLVFRAKVQIGLKYFFPVTSFPWTFFNEKAARAQCVRIKKDGHLSPMPNSELVEGELLFTASTDSDEARRALRNYFASIQLSLVNGTPEEYLSAIDRVISKISIGHTSHVEALNGCYLEYSICKGEIAFNE